MRWRARRLQGFEAFARLGPMHIPERRPRRDQAQVRTHSCRDGLWKIRRQVIERGADDSPEPFRSQPSSCFIDRDDATDLQRFSCFLFGAIISTVAGLAQYFELRLDDLELAAALVLFDLPVERDHLPGNELILEIGRVEP